MTSYYYKTFWPRFWAGFIDSLIFMPIGFLNHLIFSESRPIFFIAIWAIVPYLSYSAYSIFSHGKWGKTVGKRIMGVTVMDVSEQRLPTYWQAFLRDSFYVFASLIALIGFWHYLFIQGYNSTIEDSWVGNAIGWISMAWAVTEIVTMLSNSRRRALHDWIANTVVMRT